MQLDSYRQNTQRLSQPQKFANLLNTRSSNSSVVSGSNPPACNTGGNTFGGNQEYQQNMLRQYNNNHQIVGMGMHSNIYGDSSVNTISTTNTANGLNSISHNNSSNGMLHGSSALPIKPNINLNNISLKKNTSIQQQNANLSTNGSQRSNSSLRINNYNQPVPSTLGSTQNSVKNSQLRKNASQVTLASSNTSQNMTGNQTSNTLGLENYYNAKHQSTQQTCDLVKEIPSMRSFACTLNEDSSKEIEKQVRGKLKMDQALNKDRILMPQDAKGLVLLYGNGGTRDERKRQNSKDSFERSWDGDSYDENQDTSNSQKQQFRRRSNSMQNNQKLKHQRGQSKVQDPNKKILSNSIFGGMGTQVNQARHFEISSYKRDAANLLVNRISKKFRSYFVILQDFAAFQEEVQAMANYNSKFNINDAFEDFKQKQDEKSKLQMQSTLNNGEKQNKQLQSSHHAKKLSHSQAVYNKNEDKGSNRWQQMTYIQDNFLKELQDNKIFLSQDKMMSTSDAAGFSNMPTSNLKIKIQNPNLDHTPVNIFQTYLKSNQNNINNLVSPIPQETQPIDFYDLDTEDEYFDLPQKLGLTSARQHQESIRPLNPNQLQQQQTQSSTFHHPHKSQVMQNIKSTFKEKVKNIKSDFNNLLSTRGCMQNSAALGDSESDNLMPSQVAQEKNMLIMSQRSLANEDKENNFNFSNKNNEGKFNLPINGESLTSRGKQTQIRKDQIIKNISGNNSNGAPIKLSVISQKKNLRVLQISKESIDEQQTALETQSSRLMMSEEQIQRINEKLLGIAQYKELKHKYLCFQNWKQILNFPPSAQDSLHISHISLHPQNHGNKFINKDSTLFNTQLFDDDQRPSARGNFTRKNSFKQEKDSINTKLFSILMNKRSNLLKLYINKWKSQSKQKSLLDEEAQCKADLLKMLINQMLQNQTLRGFKTWKEATQIQHEKRRFDKQKASEKMIQKIKNQLFKQALQTFSKWKQQTQIFRGTSKGSQIQNSSNSLSRQLKLFKIIYRKQNILLSQSFKSFKHNYQNSNLTTNNHSQKFYSSSSSQIKQLAPFLKLIQRKITQNQIKQMKALMQWRDLIKLQTFSFNNSQQSSTVSNDFMRKTAHTFGQNNNDFKYSDRLGSFSTNSQQQNSNQQLQNMHSRITVANLRYL